MRAGTRVRIKEEQTNLAVVERRFNASNPERGGTLDA